MFVPGIWDETGKRVEHLDGDALTVSRWPPRWDSRHPAALAAKVVFASSP
jgi:hypothetical protein